MEIRRECNGGENASCQSKPLLDISEDTHLERKGKKEQSRKSGEGDLKVSDCVEPLGEPEEWESSEHEPVVSSIETAVIVHCSWWRPYFGTVHDIFQM